MSDVPYCETCDLKFPSDEEKVEHDDTIHKVEQGEQDKEQDNSIVSKIKKEMKVLDGKRKRKNPYTDMCDQLGIDYKKSWGIDKLKSVINSELDRRESRRGNIEKEVKKDECVETADTVEVVETVEPVKELKDDEAKEETAKNKNVIMSCVNACHNMLRSYDHIVGEKAMHDIMRVLFLKFLEPLIGVDGPVKMLEIYEDNRHELMKLSVFIKKSTSTTLDVSKAHWEVMSDHPLTKTIFKKAGNKFEFWNCTQETLFELLYKVSSDLSKTNFIDLGSDIKGAIYEDFLNRYNNKAGKEFGQYFTPRELISLAFQKIPNNIQLDVASDNFSVIDPCMGTCGFLVEAYKHLGLKDIKNGSDKLYGYEIESETYNYALMNLILTTGSINQNNIISGDSMVDRDPRKKVDLIVTNPPFSLKVDYKNLKMKYENKYAKELKDTKLKFPRFRDIYIIKTNNGVSLFLQMYVNMLKPGGMCIVIIPNGEVVNGKKYRLLRKYVMSVVDVKQIIYIPGGVFKHAGVKTAVIYLYKPTGDDRDHNVRFLDASKDLKEVKDMGTIEVGEEKLWSWEISYYKTQEATVYGTTEWKALGDICSSVNGKCLTKKDIKDGQYPVIGGGKEPYGFHNNYNTEEDTILCSGSGSAGYLSKYETRVWKSDCFSIEPNDIKMKPFVWCYLKSYQDKIYEYKSGMAQPHIYWADLKALQIPVPPLEIQERIVKELDEVEEAKKAIKVDIEAKRKMLDMYIKYTNPPFYKYTDQIEQKSLGDLFDLVKGIYSTTKTVRNTNGSCLFVTVASKEKWENVDADGEISESLFVSNVSSGKLWPIHYYNGKFIYCDLLFKLIPKISINIKYVYHYLLSNIQEKMVNYIKGSANKSLDLFKFKALQIPIPPLEVQEEFVKFYENKEATVNKIKAGIKAQEQYLESLEELSRIIINDFVVR